eukprot:6214791-Pleurochrysis_carterae.AAC.2
MATLHTRADTCMKPLVLVLTIMRTLRSNRHACKRASALSVAVLKLHYLTRRRGSVAQVISSVGPLYGLGSLVAFTTFYSVPQ